jgi:hypothetical protein
MPYLICPDCRISAYSAAGHSTTDHCPSCHASLKAAEPFYEVGRRHKIADLRVAVRQEMGRRDELA